MKVLDLFSGIGGFSLAAEWVGFETAAFCEIDEKCQKVLKKHWPNVPIHSNIKELNGVDYAGIDIITGGYPCQPFSVAGSQKAQSDDRHLWPEMFRVITQAKPTWTICENVLGHVRLGLDKVLNDLESIGYTCQSFIIPALAKGANHNRERVFIVAYSSSNGPHEGSTTRSNETANGNGKKGAHKNSNNERLGSLRAGMERGSCSPWAWGAEPPALRVDDGLPDRMDRNKMLGNSIHPSIAYELFKAIRNYK
jgi:DNA (cytosine-5)-methyltransferase 1